MLKGIWVNEYDFHTDKMYKCPGCPECREPAFRHEDGLFYCASCGIDIEFDDEMLKWYADREEIKIEMRDCIKLSDTIGCGGKKCMETHYRRNPVTMEWETAGGRCLNCGTRFIV